MSGSLINEDSLVKLAGVIRQKNGLSLTYKPREMPDAIDALNTESVEVDPISITLLNDTITSFDDSVAKKIKTIKEYAFYHCSGLTEAILPVCTSIGAYAFAQTTSLRRVSIPACTSVLDYAFDGCTGLQTLGDGVKIGSINSYGFRNCTSLAKYVSQNGGTINTNAFQNCTSLVSADFGGYCNIYNAFSGCTNLESITLRFATYVCQIQGTASTFFATTKIPTTGHIYVPANLVQLYKDDERWGTLRDQIAEIPPEIIEGGDD